MEASIRSLSTSVFFIFIVLYCDKNQISAKESNIPEYKITCFIAIGYKRCSGENGTSLTDFSKIPESTTSLLLHVYTSNLYNQTDELKKLKNITKLSIQISDKSSNISLEFLVSFHNLQSLRIDSENLFETDWTNKSHRLSQLKELILDKYSPGLFPSNFFCSFPEMKNLTLHPRLKTNLTNLHCGDNNSCCLNLEAISIFTYTSNSVKFVTSNVFHGLFNLKSLSLEHTEFLFPCDASKLFTDLHNVIELRFSSIYLSHLPDSIFFPLHHLHSLDLSHNGLSSDSLTSLKPLKSLESLDITSNKIKVLHFEFHNLPHLKKLLLMRNKMSDINPNSLKQCYNLKYIDLSSNSLNSLTSKNESGKSKKIFRSDDLPKLEYLNLMKNKIHFIDSSMIPKTVKILDITDIPLISFCINQTLEELIADHTLLTYLQAFCLPPSIKILSLQNTNISRLPAKIFSTLKNLTELRLERNPLAVVDRFAFSSSNGIRSPVNIIIDFQNYSPCCFINSISKQYKEYCPKRKKIIYTIETIHINDNKLTHLCQYVKMCNKPVCGSCQGLKTNVLDCGSLQLTAVPSDLPNDSTILYLDANNLDKVDLNAILENNSLIEILYLNESNVHEIKTVNGNLSFNKHQLQELHLEYNHLEIINGKEFSGLQKVKMMFLHHNKIHFINKNAFEELTSLEILTLHINKLKQLQIWNFHLSPNIKNVTIHKNPISCKCEYLKKLRRFLISNKNISKVSEINCLSTENKIYSIDQFDDFLLNYCEKTGREEIIGLSVSIVIFLLTSLISFFLYKYRLEIQVILYSRFNIRLFFYNESIEEKQFHAFVAYSYDDREFVANQLVPHLDQYRLCLHDRNFTIGLFIQENIINAINNSCFTLIIFSTSFVKSQWCKYEFRTAYEKTLKARYRPLLVIIIEDVNPDDLDDEMKMYLRTTTYLRWGDKLFWEKLYFVFRSLDGNDTERNRLNEIPLQEINR